MSTLFKWKESEMDNLLATCETDEITSVINKYLSEHFGSEEKVNIPKDVKILESGCGAGRFVKYLSDKGWDITGLEYVSETVKMINAKWPELKIIQGDAAASPFSDNYFSLVISLGVVEHFQEEGLKIPLEDIYRILKPGGIAIITVPCLNTIRKIKHYLWIYEILGIPRAIAKLIIKNTSFTVNRINKKYLYFVHPPYGDFFEYRLTTQQFIEAVSVAGFRVIEHIPIGHIDGIYHDINPFELFVNFNNSKFKYSLNCKLFDKWLRQYPFAHCHMQAVVVTK